MPNPDQNTPIAPASDQERLAHVEMLRKLFAEWDEEDAKLPDWQANLLAEALEQSRGMAFRSSKSPSEG